MTSYTVGTKDLRDAVRAVRIHADRTKTGGEGDGACHRVRFSFGRTELVVMATCIVTTAAAIVDLLTDDGRPVRDALDLADDDGTIPPTTIVDVIPAKAALILQAFKAATHDPDGVAQLLRFDILEDGLEVTDVSGLFAGDAYVMQGAGKGAAFPDVWATIERALKGAGTEPSPKPLTASGPHVSRFQIASKVYDTPLTISPTGTPESRGFLVECGPKFLGVISSGHNDDDSLGKRDAARRRWLHRFDGRQLKAVQ